jgi:hypothetical protein
MQQDSQDMSPDMQELLGSQGNEGMYGQGQYDAEGKPDMRGVEAQRLQPDTHVSNSQTQAQDQQVGQGGQDIAQGNAHNPPASPQP